MTPSVQLSRDTELMSAISDLHDKVDLLIDPRMDAAVAEMTSLISRRHPEATFSVWPIEDPVLGLLLTARVSDPDDAGMDDLLAARLTDIQVDDQLPLYVSIIAARSEMVAPTRIR